MRKLLLTAVSLLIAFILSEGIVRLSGYRPRIIDAQMFQSHADPLMPYKLKPGYSGYYVGGEVHIEADGNRLVLPKCVGKSVLILGDSIAFGQGVDDKETIGSQLQKETCDRYQIRSLAAPGYSSWNEFAAFRDYKYPVSRLILIYVPNDITFENNHLKIKGDSIADTSSSQIHRLLRGLYSRIYLSSLLAETIKRLRPTESGIPPVSDHDMLAYSMDAIQRIYALCRERNTEFSVAIYRDIWHYDQPTISTQYEEKIAGSLNAMGIDNFVLKSHIEGLQPHESRLSFNDPHPSRKAVELIALEIKPHL